MMMHIESQTYSTQRGAALITSLVILLVLTVLGISAMRNSSLQESIVGNLRDSDLAFQLADTGLTAAEIALSAAPPSLPPNNKIFQRGTFGDLSISAYDTTGVWTGTNTTSVTVSIPYISANPSYVVELEQQIPDNLDPNTAATPGMGRIYYRITSRGVGISPNSPVLLQEIYGVR